MKAAKNMLVHGELTDIFNCNIENIDIRNERLDKEAIWVTLKANTEASLLKSLITLISSNNLPVSFAFLS